MLLPFLLIASALVWFAYDSGLELAGFHRGESQRELAQLRAVLARLTEENIQLGRLAAQYQQHIQMEQGRNQENALQIKRLGDENIRLQEDLNFFQNLTAANSKEGELVIHRLSVEHDKIPGEYRVRMLLVQGGQRVKEFTGGYQLIATLAQNGRKTARVFPFGESGHEQFSLNFKYYQRLDQIVRVAADMQLNSIEVRLFDQGTHEPRVRQSITIQP